MRLSHLCPFEQNLDMLSPVRIAKWNLFVHHDLHVEWLENKPSSSAQCGEVVSFSISLFSVFSSGLEAITSSPLQCESHDRTQTTHNTTFSINFFLFFLWCFVCRDSQYQFCSGNWLRRIFLQYLWWMTCLNCCRLIKTNDREPARFPWAKIWEKPCVAMSKPIWSYLIFLWYFLYAIWPWVENTRSQYSMSESFTWCLKSLTFSRCLIEMWNTNGHGRSTCCARKLL